MLLQQWKILQAALPRDISVQRAIILVNCLAKLHNWCNNKTDGKKKSVIKVLPLEAVVNLTVPCSFATLDTRFGYQPGGTCSITVNAPTGCLANTFSNPLGRWNAVTLQSKHNQTATIITIYQPHDFSVKVPG